MASTVATLAQDLRRNLLAGARLALFMPVRALDFRVSVGQYAVLVLASLAFWLAAGMLREGFPGHVDSGALTTALAQIPFVLGACFAAARLYREPQLALAIAVLMAATDPVSEVVGLAVQFVTDFDAAAPYANAANWAFLAWTFAVLARVQLVLAGWRGRTSAAAFALFAVLVAALIAFLPRTELWAPDDGGDETGPSVVQEEIFHRQGALLDEQIAALRPERRGTADLYFVGVAADGGQDTFYKELLSVKRLLDERFDAQGRTILLVNNPATLKELPIASVTNLRAALEGVGRRMDADNDILLLHITTHGGSDHRLAFDLPPLELAQLTPTALARMLADSGIKWKVIVISACYAGGYIEPLKDDNTLIVTASDATHTSFGCSADSDYTWFSEAYYEDALRETRSFTEAFEMAKETVAEREQAEGYAPSNPQMFVGSAMRAKLAALERRLERGAAPADKLRSAAKERR